MAATQAKACEQNSAYRPTRDFFYKTAGEIEKVSLGITMNYPAACCGVSPQKILYLFAHPKPLPLNLGGA